MGQLSPLTVTVSNETETRLFVASNRLTLSPVVPGPTLRVPVTRLLAALFRVEIIIIILPLVPQALAMTWVIPTI